MNINDLKKLLKPADLLLIVPPVMDSSSSTGAHVLQACCQEAGFSVQIFYANILFASHIGEDYKRLCDVNFSLQGERVFARAAFGDQCHDVIHENIYSASHIFGSRKASRMQKPVYYFPPDPLLSISRLKEIEETAQQWTEELFRLIAQIPYQVIGCSSNHEQINASFAFLKEAKKNNPGITTLIGGANCEGECSKGVASLDPERKVIDHIFSGESENSLVDFLIKFKDGVKEERRMIHGEPYPDMDRMPAPDYSQYYEQLYSFMPGYVMNRKSIEIWYETSRGCWWGEKKHCLFCGVNGEQMTFRQKSAGKVLKDLKKISKFNIHKLQMADRIMPENYFTTLLPELEKENYGFSIFYELKANLSYEKMKLLKNAGVTEIQPGIETFSDTLLRQMNKGTTGRNNLQLLRDALTLKFNVHWNILWGFPDEESQEYQDMLDYLPLFSHLQPPFAIHHFIIDKFSPYYYNHKHYGIQNFRPINSYREIFPGYADIEKIAYFFNGDYEAGTYKDHTIIRRCYDIVEQWNQNWHSPESRSLLHLSKKSNDEYILTDTRELPGTGSSYILSRQKAAHILQHGKYTASEDKEWAVENKAALVMKDHFVSLITTTPDLMEELAHKQHQKAPV